MYDYSDLEKIWNGMYGDNHAKNPEAPHHQGGPIPHHEAPVAHSEHHHDPIKEQYFAQHAPSYGAKEPDAYNHDDSNKTVILLKAELDKAEAKIEELTLQLQQKEQELLNVDQYLAQMEKFIEKFD